MSLQPKKLELWATYYYIPTVSHAEEGIPLLDVNEEETGIRLSPIDWFRAAIEGTVLINRNEEKLLFNFAGRSKDLQIDCRDYLENKNYPYYEKTGRVAWKASSGYGLGVENYKLHPFKSIAVDPSTIPIGSVVYIPKAKGVIYLNEEGTESIHDGYFMAVDRR